MFKKVFVSLAVLLLLTPSNAQQEVLEPENPVDDGQYPLPGKCPEIKDSMTKRGEKLDPQKLKGLWKSVYESEDQTFNQDCLSEKIQSFENGNSTELQILNGIKHSADGKGGMYYEDDKFFTFNHPTNSGQGAIENEQQKSDPGMKKFKASLELALRDLTEEEKSKMTQDQLEDFEEEKNSILLESPKILQSIDKMNPYDNSIHVLDTDYDNYAIYWNCIGNDEERNQVGQTREDLELLKVANPDDIYHEDFKYTHQVSASIQVRSLKELTTEKVQDYVKKLHAMVPDHDWTTSGSGHKIFEHGVDCPSENIDIFTLPDIKKLDEMEYVDVEPEDLQEPTKEEMFAEQKENVLQSMKDADPDAPENFQEFSDEDFQKYQEIISQEEQEFEKHSKEHGVEMTEDDKIESQDAVDTGHDGADL